MSVDSVRRLPVEVYREAVVGEAARLAELVRGADLSVMVPACPEWSLAELVVHVGGVHRWFTVLLSGLVQERPDRRALELGLPESVEGYADWLAAGAGAAVAVVAATDPDAPMWTWGADGCARFWARRMVFETVVHRMDAEAAVGVVSVVDAGLAADGVDEFLVNLPFAEFFAPAVAGLRGADEVIRFESVDTGDGWSVRLGQEGFGLVPDGVGAGAVVRGSAVELLLALYGRRSVEGLAVSGDAGLVGRWFANSRF
ncbi:maleylpyruvate isomerase family mycothiol-dependent enzyme [Solihabitans fulvus]|uniref:Maleylpyruvate isomerase family mycothiol-dependent enzyme n=1 Tax=Solihabitans fulvus TaxID=1892852 RepID=A0A5B2XQQ0_9PSEU|nr:maleylpyruvate isomerase family mycothiol-dependent enzyme [Solihabitans fulvus]KAA2265746.1 maleylpyruvate isomerase family mycothiol-dependent enzyme [Solihabitans fulvus]